MHFTNRNAREALHTVLLHSSIEKLIFKVACAAEMA